MRNEALHRVKENRILLYTIKRRKANLIGHILCRNCLLKHVTEEKEKEEQELISYQIILRKRRDTRN